MAGKASDFGYALTQYVPPIFQPRQHLGGLVLIKLAVSDGAVVRAANRAVENICVVKGNQFGGSLDRPPRFSVSPVEKRTLLLYVTHNKPTVLALWVLTGREKT